MTDEPRPDQTLPGDLDPAAPNQDLPVEPTEETEEDEDETPPGQDPDKVRGRSAEAHERAPGQQKQDDEA